MDIESGTKRSKRSKAHKKKEKKTKSQRKMKRKDSDPKVHSSNSFLRKLVSLLKCKDAKTAAYRIFIAIWCTCVLVAALNLLGFRVRPVESFKSGINSIVELTKGKPPETPAPTAGLLKLEQLHLKDGAPKKRDRKAEKALEIRFACGEVDCIDKCNRKIKPKCAKSKSCRNERNKICHKRCRRARCEDRCKDAPKLGYVEREQGMEKCKANCKGSTAVHNKCVKKCHSEWKPCKARCFDVAHRYSCDRPVAPVGASASASSPAAPSDDEGEALLGDSAEGLDLESSSSSGADPAEEDDLEIL